MKGKKKSSFHFPEKSDNSSLEHMHVPELGGKSILGTLNRFFRQWMMAERVAVEGQKRAIAGKKFATPCSMPVNDAVSLAWKFIFVVVNFRTEIKAGFSSIF